MGNNRGFTLLEMVVVIAIVATLAAFAMPAFKDWNTKQAYKEAARSVYLTLKEARSEAVRRGVTISLEVNLDGTQLRLDGGDWVGVNDEEDIRSANLVSLESGSSATLTDPCNENSGTKSVTFRPNGTVKSTDLRFVCVVDTAGQEQRRVQLVSLLTGKVKIPNP